MTAPNAEFGAQVAEAVRAERAAKIDSLGREATLWLAVVPLWTASVAQAAGFPVPSVLDFVRRAREAGWCETRGSLRDGAAGDLRFWMPDEHRRAVLDLMIRRDGEVVVLAEATLIAGSVGAISPLPGALGEWAELIGEAEPAPALVDRARRAVESGDLTRAQELVSAGEALAALRAGAMELAVDRVRRLLSLGTRRRQDARALERYLDRPELSGAVDRLARGDLVAQTLVTPGSVPLVPVAKQRWALHLRGVGGTGKTMLIRYLAAGRYAADRRKPAIAIARVDFDHMSPDYPVRRPVQLLLELADELSLHTAAVGSADRVLARFRNTAASVHESLSGVREEQPSPMRNPRVLAAIDDFAEAIRLLPEVLLILDTCEELAKADAGDPAAPAVRTTLAILERVHDRAPNVRVLFAGRRSLPPRPYLEVQDVAGFTLGEARRYLSVFSGTPLAPELADEMIRQSPGVDVEVPAPGELPARVSPFDLALYLGWAREDPELDVQRVARGSDAYIEGRIIERLRDPGVLRALPALACAGRCRVETIAWFTDANASTLGPRLAEQEWIDSEGDPLRHVAAKPALARRLRHYFEATDRAAGFAAETARLARALRAAITDVSFDDIDTDEVLAALRLSDPGDAAALWDHLADRAAVAGRWNWLLNVTRRVLGESQEEGWPTANALRATVLASYVAASRRASATFDSRAAWTEVRASAEHHPSPESRKVLLARAALGLLAYTPSDRPALRLVRTELRARPGSLALELELLAAAGDTAYRLLEAGHPDAAARIIEGRGFALRRSQAEFRVSAWLLAVEGRLYADSGNREGALNFLETAESQAIHAMASPEPASGPGLADWVPPDDLLARVRLERGLVAPPEEDVLQRWEEDAEGGLGTTDGDRLASLCLRTRLGRGVIEPSVIERWEQADHYERHRVATCSAHDLVPPLFVTLADAWLAAGDPRRALDLIEHRRAAALDTRDDDATIRHADAATIRIARRLRLDDQRALLERLAGSEGPPSPALVASARRALAVVHGQLPRPEPDMAGPEGWHTWWQCQTSTTGPVPPPLWPSDDTDTELAADIELDLEEMWLLRHPRHRDVSETLAGWLALPRPSRVRSADPYPDARADLRQAVLYKSPRPPDIPPRLFAEMAFDEAELLALRLPDEAARLFRYACHAFRIGHDPIGAVLAGTSLAAITADPEDLTLVQTAVEELTDSQPEVAAALTGPAERAGPWRYWAGSLRRVQEGETRAPLVGAMFYGQELVGGILSVYSTTAGIAGAIAVVAAAYWASPAGFLIGVLSLLGVLLIAVIVTGAWRVRDVQRMADGRGIGVFRPPIMSFTVVVARGRADRRRVFFWTRLGALVLAPRRRWAGLLFMATVAGLAATLRRNPHIGYDGTVTGRSRRAALTWRSERPEADSGWWAGGTVPGRICLDLADAYQPWERILTASLGPGAAGDVEWIRQYPGYTRRRVDRTGAGVRLSASPRWRRVESQYLPTQAGPPPDSPIRVRHAIGQAIVTSAGPRLDISSAASPHELLGPDALTSGGPTMIILQAEPVPEDTATGQIDDLREKLALAVDVTRTAACDVLIIPALPAVLLTEVAACIVRHADRGGAGSRRLLTDLRELVRNHVSPAVLDDFVLFNRYGRY